MTLPLDHFYYNEGVLNSDGVSLLEVAQKYETPAYIYSSEAFLDPLQKLQKGLKSLDFLVCFAMKSNSNLAILKLLSEAGAGLDLVSGGELFRAGAIKMDPNRIVFSGVGKTQQEITAALDFQGKGIFSFNVESLPELDAIHQVALRLGKKAPVAFRFNPHVDPKTHPYISTGLKKNKFGMEREEILGIVQRLKDYQAIQLKGLSIHIGSQLLSLSPLNDAFTRLKNLVREISPYLASPLSFLDVGGGLGITYKNEKAPSLEAYCHLIRKHFEKLPYKILLEPGRTLAGNAGVLITQILYRRQRKNKNFLVVDAGMNDLIRPALYESYHQIIPIKKSPARTKLTKFDVVGPVCETSDSFASNRELPDCLQEGDFLAILSAGAYGFAMSSQYNSRPRPPEILIQAGKTRLIRSREKYADLIHGEIL